MIGITITKLYEQFVGKLGKETAENLTTFIDNKIVQELESKIHMFATKQDLSDAIAKLECKITETKSEMIKWMFIFWIGQVIANKLL